MKIIRTFLKTNTAFVTNYMSEDSPGKSVWWSVSIDDGLIRILDISNEVIYRGTRNDLAYEALKKALSIFECEPF